MLESQSRPRRILFASIFSLLDTSNGATVATASTLDVLAKLGFECHVLCGSRSLGTLPNAEQQLTAGNIPFNAFDASLVERNVRVVLTRIGLLSVTMLRVRTLGSDPFEEAPAFYAAFQETLETLQPDVLIFIGADQIDLGFAALARRAGVSVVFMIHNLDMANALGILSADVCVTPSAFAARFYQEVLSADCTVLPLAVDWKRGLAPTREARFATFVNPSAEKGVYAFARIADELGRRRPDIPLLVVESRGTRATLAACGLEFMERGNLTVMPHTSDPRRFWGVTRLCLMPSLWWENQPLVAIEAMINGVPVIGSNRGGIPETLGCGGIVLSLPERLNSGTRELPSASEVSAWVETVIRLWDHSDEYEEASERARREAQRWHPDRVGALYKEFFSNAPVRRDSPMTFRRS